MAGQTAGRNLATIRNLVGAITKEQLRYVDCFVARDIALFMPVGGPCFYALTPEHTHPGYMFILNFNEEVVVRLDGRKIAGKPGKVFALSPDIPHQELPSVSPPRYIGVMISRRFFEKHYRLYTRRKPEIFRGTFFDPGEGFAYLLKRFMIEADNRTGGRDAVLDALGIEICHALIRTIVKTPAGPGRIADRVEVSRVIEYLHSHLDGKITIDLMAQLARLSASHFARVFKAETGKAPMEYVQDLRLERAKKLLLAGDKTMTEIALDCGFGSASYLSACFQKRCKMTPKEYRKNVG
jgi:AraC family transcriptional regulator